MPTQDPSTTLPRIYTTEELALMWKVTPRTISRFAKNKELQGFRLGKNGDWRFPQAAVEDFILRNSGWIVDRSRSPRLGRKKRRVYADPSLQDPS